ncbi:beta strand repeat-containing protein [Afipia carboxidovorans]|uniref:beta strand repeat-containing protein n=1 Tax=Afipia carboxidovorans TaxID=40137 RepID=UPI0003242687|nr:hypothetical protein [Afipia carboxidovorans]
MAGNYTFSGTSNAAVINQGRIRAHNGGYVALLGKTVSNDGVISARLGTVAMAAGEKMTLNFEGNSLLDVTIDKGTLNALVENKRAIRADGGQVILTAKAADQLLSAQVNNTGIVQARTIAALKGGSGKVKIGKIKIVAEGGKANVSGKLDASAPKGGKGGFIETSGDKVKIADDAVITTKSATGEDGTWLIDPTDFNIVAGSGSLTTSGIGAGTLSQNLQNGNIAIATIAGGTENGDINVNAAVNWSANTTLTLTATAGNNLNVAAPVSWTGNQTVTFAATSGDLSIYDTLTPSGTGGTLDLCAGGDVKLSSALSLGTTTLAATAGSDVDINAALSWSGDTTTTLTAGQAININAPVTATGTNAALAMTYGTDYTIWTPASYSGAVLNADGIPVAQIAPADAVYGSITLSGANAGLTMNGQAYTLIHSMADLAAIAGGTGHYALAQDLNASTPYTDSVVSTFGGTLAGLGHKVSNLTVSATGVSNVGLIGKTNGAVTIRDIGVVDANIAGKDHVGALVGYGSSGLKVSHAYSTGSVTGTEYVGGLIGLAGDAITANPTTFVSNSFSSATLDTDGTQSYLGADFGGLFVGGLIGQAISASITSSHASGAVSGIQRLGGLIGGIYYATTDLSYATGNVKGTGYTVDSGGTITIGVSAEVGGLIGYIETVSRPTAKSSISNSFSTGAVEADWKVGGLVGVTNTTAPRAGYEAFYTNISNSYHIGGTVTAKGTTVSGSEVRAGGLVGDGNYTNISDSFVIADVVSKATGPSQNIGGLVGFMQYGSVSDSYVVGNVTGALLYSQFVGGLIGNAGGAIVSNSSHTGDVTGGGYVGGLIGNGGDVRDSWANGNVIGDSVVGGLVGGAGNIANSWSDGTVTGHDNVGGLAGLGGGIITGSWTNSQVIANSPDSFRVGGLIGQLINGSVTNSHWNVETSGQNDAFGSNDSGYNPTVTNVTGMTSQQMEAAGLSPVAPTPIPNTSTVTGTSPGQAAGADAAAAVNTAA